MEIILHRRNTIDQLISTPNNYGVEIDIRSFKDELIIQHDPFLKGENFKNWIKFYNHGTLILNIKEEGLEQKILMILKENNINSFFFLDQSIPMVLDTIRKGENRIALRVSEYESFENVIKLKENIKWIWIDMFTEFPLSLEEYKELKKTKLKLCLVSPELQLLNNQKISNLKKYFIQNNIIFDAVCTKKPSYWI